MNFLLFLPTLLAQAATSLLSRRLRSSLTILGLGVGVTALVTLQIIGAITGSAVRTLLGGIDEHAFFLFPISRQTDLPNIAFSKKDIEHMRNLSPTIIAVLPFRSISRLVQAEHHRARLIIRGEGELDAADTPLLYGRTLSHDDSMTDARVCVLTNPAYHRIFKNGEDPVGFSLRVDEQRYVVVGVQAAGLGGFTPGYLRGDILIPYATYEVTQARSQPLLALRFIVRDALAVPQTESIIMASLERLHKAGSYQTFDRATLASTVNNVCMAITLAASFINLIALVVAGIAIMNVMLVSVTERVREIGVRKAIGASDAHIFTQFVSEAFLLALIGCGAGLFGGLLIGARIDHIIFNSLRIAAPSLPWERPLAIAAGLTISVTVVFGTYPAYHAMRCTPIEALRAE